MFSGGHRYRPFFSVGSTEWPGLPCRGYFPPVSFSPMQSQPHAPEALFPDSLLIEVAWEVCNQVGGIYTVIRSKAPAMMKNHSGNFCMVGPYVSKHIQAEIE